jgi:MinD-like ATPase involved in chromosome partitioning or flagellar assembly
MANGESAVVTAIRDMHQEGFIAAALSRLGWKVSMRATDLYSLSKYVAENPEILIVASDDFKGIEKIEARNLILLRGLSQALISGAVVSPVSDSELHHLMNSIYRSSTEKSVKYPKIETSVFTIASLGRNVGTTFVAINLAAEIALQERSVLLVDCHSTHPSISSYLSLHGLKEKIMETEFGFSATEISSTERILQVTELASQFDVVVIDLGELLLSEQTSVGGRLSDVLSTWALRSSKRLHLVSDSIFPDNDECFRRLQVLRKVSEVSYIDRVVMFREIMNKREILLLKKSSEDRLGIPVFIYPYDRRAIQAIRRDHSPLAHTAAKSLLRAEIQSHLQACENRVQLKAR